MVQALGPGAFPIQLTLLLRLVTLFSFHLSQGISNHDLQAFISFFYHQRSRPKTTEPEKPAKRSGRARQPLPEETPANGIADPDLIAVPEPTPEEAEMCAALESADIEDVEDVDADKATHDKQAVATVRTEAVAIAKSKYKMELNSEEAQTALGLFPKV